MSDYNITTGWYKYRNGINGKLVNVYKITKQFVAVKIYQYHDNKYDLTNMNEEDLSFHSLKTKVKVYPSNIEFPYIHPKKGSPLKFKLTHKQREDYVKPVVVNEEEEEQPPSPDDGTAEYDIDEQLAKEKETEVVKIFATEVNIVECPKCDGGGSPFCDCEVKEVINDSIMKDPEVCRLIVKNHILEIIVNEIFGKDKERVDSKYYVEITDAIHKL